MRRRLAAMVGIVAAATVLSVTALAGPAAAHFIDINPPGNAEPKSGWVGGPVPLPGKGQGLVLGGPQGDALMTPAHEKGLNRACEALRRNGNGVVDIYGPPHQSALPPGLISGCPHGSVIPAP